MGSDATSGADPRVVRKATLCDGFMGSGRGKVRAVSSRDPLSGAAVVPLAIEVARRQNTVVVTVSGEIDAHTSPQLRSCLLEQVAQGGGGTVLIDLTAVTFCDSTALGVLVGTHRRLQGEGRRLEICAASASVRHLFEVSGLDHVLHLG